MSRGVVSFLAGFGGGMMQAQDKKRANDRQDKEDEYRNEVRDRDRREWAAKDKLESDLKDAATPRATMAGTVTEGGGNKYLSADPAQAASMQATLAAEAEMKGEAAPTQQAGTGIVGGMARGNEITTAPVDVAKVNSPDARNERVLGALRQNGQVERAIGMENTILDQSAKRLGLDMAQAKFADEQFNRRLTERLASPEWGGEAAKMLSETQVGSMAGVTVAQRPTADGKSIEFVGTQDGKERVLGKFENSEAGKAKFMQQVARVPLEAKIGWVVEDARAAKEDSRWQQTFDFNKKKEENDQQYRNRMLSIQMAQEGRAAATHRLAMEDAKIPPGVKAKAGVLSDQIKSVGNALNKAMAEGQFDPANPGTAKLIEQQASLNLQYSKLIQPYLPGQTGAADPLGLGSGGAPTAAPAQSAAPASAAPQRVAAPPAAPAAPAPTMEQIQAQTRANRERIAQQSEVRRQASADPAVQALKVQHAQALRDGKAVEANAIMSQINQVMKQRYGVQ